MSEYFVETASYFEALEGRHGLFVGRKGAGKTANLYRIASKLGSDRRNLVCVIKPEGYDVHGLLRLLSRYGERDAKGYLVESLWKFLLYTEVANELAAEIGAKAAVPPPGSDQDRLVTLLENGGWLGEDFTVRLERAVEKLCEIEAGDRVDSFRIAVSETLHKGVLKELRGILGELLAGRERVAVLIDNLDKAWDASTDLSAVS